MEQTERVDKWLWAVRIYKTRSIATEACKKGRVTIGGKSVKPSRMIKINDQIDVKKDSIIYSFKVVNLVGKRIGAKLVDDFMKDITPKEQLEQLELNRINNQMNRDRGEGRPTKKERRTLDDFFRPD